MTNFEKWRAYMDGFVSPDCYINFGFYYLIAAALQRRVWCGPEHSPCYSNNYTILTGEPAIGKGLVLKQVSNILKYHTMADPREIKAPKVSNEEEKAEQAIRATTQKENFDNALMAEKSSSGDHSTPKVYEKPLVIPVAADASTYEALVRAMSRSLRMHAGQKFDPKLNKMVSDVYIHSSLCFCLEEISSLFRKHTQDLVNFLLQAYDCGDYVYDTKTQGRDKIKRCCLNFLGGTTPSFMQQSFNDSIINEGFSSRAFFIFASQNRKRPFWIPPLTSEQEQYYKEIVEHVLKLTKLFGPVKFSDEANKVLEAWWTKFQNGHERPNINIKLNPYYGRKKVHVLKLSMAIHFGESTEMTVEKWAVEKALAVLAEEEKKMHYCLGLDNSNPLAKCSVQVQKFITSIEKDFEFKNILTEFWPNLPGTNHDQRKDSLEDILEYLEYTNQIVKSVKKHPITKQDTVFYCGFKESSI